MAGAKHIYGAREKLRWIAELSAANMPGGMPAEPDAVRALLNRIVLDVRSASRMLDEATKKSKSTPNHGLIPTHGGYRNLKGFQVAEIVYDGTVIFCDLFVDRFSRTKDQMVQAARSGRQNIAEGSMASATSKKTELKLTNVAKASLEELLLDYEDHLRQNNLRQWDKNDSESLAVRNKYRSYPEEWFGKSDSSDRSAKSDSSVTLLKRDPYGVSNASAEVAANTLICLCNQAIYLLKQLIARQEKSFLEEGGFTEKLYWERKRRRAQ